MYMASVENVTGTAFVVAEFRAEENAEQTPLYRDPVVPLFLNEDSRRAAARIAASFPLVKELVKIRTRYFDDTLEREIRSGCRQVVILGAGLDTRAVRKRAARVRFFEIDDETTLRVKQACYDRERFDVDLRFIPGDYVSDGLFSLLESNDFDFDLPTYVIWEGNTMYLPLDVDKRILVELRERVTRFHVSFDYMAESVIARTTGDSGITRLAESFASMGAPWICGFRDIASLARELSLDLIEDFHLSDLYRSYQLPRPASPSLELYSICTLGHDAGARR
jgi:methyltransferase (TIGR00027 family)